MDFVREVFRRNKELAWFGLINFLAFLVLIVISFFDDRTLSGVNVWIKPMKFCISIGIFSWTMAWFLIELPQKAKARLISRVIISVLLVEQVIIIGQASKGELSHFNISTSLNETLFNIMGIAIFINTLMVFRSFLLFLKVKHLPAGYLRGIRWGMLIFIFASMEGFLMAANLGHTVGATDGQEGIFFLDWAKSYGDLRIFHFLGLHALQILPLLAWLTAKYNSRLVTGYALTYFLLSLGTFWHALAGRGLFYYF
jgi:hypothetical protein